MGLLDILSEWLFGKKEKEKISRPTKTMGGKDMDTDKINMEDTRMESKRQMKKLEEEKMKKETEERLNQWSQIKEKILKEYRIPIADDAKDISQELYGETDSLPVFFLTDERVVRQRFIEGGEKAIEEFTKNLTEHAFVGAPITATLLRRIKELNQFKNEGSVIDTEIDIDGFSPNGRMEYTLKDIDIDGQKIPARRKFSPRCEMTATVTEGFHVGPFVPYDNMYFCVKEEMEQMTSGKDMKGGMNNDMGEGMGGGIGEDIGTGMEKDSGRGMGSRKIGIEELCPHGNSKSAYCGFCNGDIIVTQRKKVIGIYLDVTGSMEGRKIENAKIAVERMLEKIPANDDIDVILSIFSTEFLNGCKDIIPYGTKFTEDIRREAIRRVNSLSANGGTPLYDAIDKFLNETWNRGAIDKEKIYFPYTYLIVVSDGEENESKLEGVEYRGKKKREGFFEKLKAYRDSGLVSEIIPFAYGDSNPQLIQDLKDISGKTLVNETDPDMITESLIDTVDSILCGSDNLKMMGIPVGGKKNAPRMKSSMESM